jgi:hypothetical protein
MSGLVRIVGRHPFHGESAHRPRHSFEREYGTFLPRDLAEIEGTRDNAGLCEQEQLGCA